MKCLNGLKNSQQSVIKWPTSLMINSQIWFDKKTISLKDSINLNVKQMMKKSQTEFEFTKELGMKKIEFSLQRVGIELFTTYSCKANGWIHSLISIKLDLKSWWGSFRKLSLSLDKMRMDWLKSWKILFRVRNWIKMMLCKNFKKRFANSTQNIFQKETWSKQRRNSKSFNNRWTQETLK